MRAGKLATLLWEAGLKMKNLMEKWHPTLVLPATHYEGIIPIDGTYATPEVKIQDAA